MDIILSYDIVDPECELGATKVPAGWIGSQYPDPFQHIEYESKARTIVVPLGSGWRYAPKTTGVWPGYPFTFAYYHAIAGAGGKAQVSIGLHSGVFADLAGGASVGATAGFTALPDIGYYFNGWSGFPPGSPSGWKSFIFPFHQPASGSASFERCPELILDREKKQGVDALPCVGYCSANPPRKYYRSGEVVGVGATALPGYRFDHWAGDGYTSDIDFSGNPIPAQRLDDPDNPVTGLPVTGGILIRMDRTRTLKAVFDVDSEGSWSHVANKDFPKEDKCGNILTRRVVGGPDPSQRSIIFEYNGHGVGICTLPFGLNDVWSCYCRGSGRFRSLMHLNSDNLYEYPLPPLGPGGRYCTDDPINTPPNPGDSADKWNWFERYYNCVIRADDPDRKPHCYVTPCDVIPFPDVDPQGDRNKREPGTCP